MTATHLSGPVKPQELEAARASRGDPIHALERRKGADTRIQSITEASHA